MQGSMILGDNMAVTTQILYDLPNDVYHASNAISKSGLDKIAESPAHYRYYKEHGTETTPAMNFGAAFHSMILEPEKDEVIVMPDEWQTLKECGVTIKDQKESFRHANQHKIIISADEMDAAKGMRTAIEAHAAARFILRKEPGKAEVSVFWSMDDIDCRARFDWVLNNGLIVDLKTTRCAKPGDFDRLAFDGRYHVQAAFYMEAYRQAYGKEPAGFAFVAVEKTPPYPVCVYLASPEFIELGIKDYKRDMAVYAECLASGEWPAYPDISLVPLNLPRYAVKLLTEGE